MIQGPNSKQWCESESEIVYNKKYIKKITCLSMVFEVMVVLYLKISWTVVFMCKEEEDVSKESNQISKPLK